MPSSAKKEPYQIVTIDNGALPVLPIDAWLEIFEYLQLSDLYSLVRINREFHDAICSEDRIWQSKCTLSYPKLLAEQETATIVEEGQEIDVPLDMIEAPPEDKDVYFTEKYLETKICTSWMDLAKRLVKTCCEYCAHDPGFSSSGKQKKKAAALSSLKPFTKRKVCDACLETPHYKLISKTAAMKTHKVSEDELSKLKYQTHPNPYHRSWAPMHLYLERQVKAIGDEKAILLKHEREEMLTAAMQDAGGNMEDIVVAIETAKQDSTSALMMYINGTTKKGATAVAKEFYGKRPRPSPKKETKKKKRKSNDSKAIEVNEEIEQDVPVVEEKITARQQSVRDKKESELLKEFMSNPRGVDARAAIDAMKATKRGVLYEYWSSSKASASAREVVFDFYEQNNVN